MRRWVGVGLALLPLLLWAPSVQAAEQVQQIELSVDSSSWTWRQTAPGVEPSNVPSGDLPVQFDGRPDAPPAKATYLRLDLTSLPMGIEVRGLTVTLPLDPAVNQDGSAAPLVACRLTAAFVAGTQANPASAPAEDCTTRVPGILNASQEAVSFALTGFVTEWLTGPNFGFVVRPDPAASVPAVLPFQLVFQGATAVGAELFAVLPALAQAPPGQGPPSVPQLPQPQVGPVFPAPLSGVFTQEPFAQPDVVPPVVSTPVQTAPPVVLPAASVAVSATGRASAAGFALAAALGALLLALIGFAFGSACDPAPVARRERSRADQLRVALVRAGQPLQIRQGRKPEASAASTVT